MAPLSYSVALLLLSSIKQRRIFFTIITSRAWNVVSVCTRQLLNPFVCFLGGSLPLTAILEFRQMSLFGIVSRLDPSSIIHRHAISTLTHNKPSSRSWLLIVRDLCRKYLLQDPLITVTNPPTKSSFKKNWQKPRLFISWIPNYAWILPVLCIFWTQIYSLTKHHPIWTSAGNDPYEVEKACCFCSLPSCRLNPTPGTLFHILISNVMQKQFVCFCRGPGSSVHIEYQNVHI